MLRSFTFHGESFSIERLDALNYRFRAYGETLATTGEDLDSEFESDVDAWAHYIIDEMHSAGLVTYSTVLESYVSTRTQIELERDAIECWREESAHQRHCRAAIY